MTKRTQITPAFYRPAEACAYLSMGRTQLHNLSEQDPTFPRKIRLGKRFVGWTKGQLDTWLSSKEPESNNVR